MNLTVRNIPEEVINIIKQRAAKNRRSLNSEILWLFENAIVEVSREKEIEVSKKQMKALKRFIGKWVDDRSSKEIIDDIYQSRTVGRDIVL